MHAKCALTASPEADNSLNTNRRLQFNYTHTHIHTSLTKLKRMATPIAHLKQISLCWNVPATTIMPFDVGLKRKKIRDGVRAL